ncbi:MAG TPA: CAP domain-containing protein [Candidatus Paceibacterota bacterium]|nr:CAP domain-containing protein [Candidatus Paceibacterota bacterium]
MNPFLLALLMFFGGTSVASANQVPPQNISQYSYHRVVHSSPAQWQTNSSRKSYVVTAPTTPTTQPANPSPQTVQSQTTSNDFVSQVEQDVFTETNTERRQNGLSALSWNDTLASVARAHSADMLANNYFNHNDLSGCSPSCRVTNAGYVWQAMGENIYMMSGYNLDAQGTADKIVQGWMNSPEHRANILNTSYTQTGVGIAVQGSTVYATSDYAQPRN